MLIVGTDEGRGSFLKSRSGVRRSLDFSDDLTVCQVDITVTDINDVSPTFIRAPLGNTITVRHTKIYNSYQLRKIQVLTFLFYNIDRFCIFRLATMQASVKR